MMLVKLVAFRSLDFARRGKRTTHAFHDTVKILATNRTKSHGWSASAIILHRAVSMYKWATPHGHSSGLRISNPSA